MMLKRGFTATMLLLLVVVLAGCSSVLPGPGTPPVDTSHGALNLHVDFTPISDTPYVPDSVVATLTHGSTVEFDGEIPIENGVATKSFDRLESGSLEVALAVLDGGKTVVAWHDTVDIFHNETTAIRLQARMDEAGETILLGSEDDGGAAPDPGDGSDGDDGVAPDPGDGSDGDGGTDPGTEPGDGDDGDKPAPDEPIVTRQVRHIQSGNRTETRTEVYIIRSSVPGPTVMVVGGVHGGETSGWIVAGEVARDWEIDRGTLVVLPEANKDAVRRRLRTGRDGRDMNRAFPYGRQINRPTDWLMAREIWNIVEEFQPVALIDLHEGWGLREANDRFPGGTLSVGQTLITYPTGDAVAFADHVIDVLNRDHNPFYGVGGYTYHFRKIGPPVKGSLAYKAGYDLGIPAFIAEPTQGRAGRHQTTVERRAAWHRVIVEEFLRWYGVLD